MKLVKRALNNIHNTCKRDFSVKILAWKYQFYVNTSTSCLQIEYILNINTESI